MRRCQFGEKTKYGKVTKSATCPNPASGRFAVLINIGFGRRARRELSLCAHCAFVAMPNRVKMVMPPDDAPRDAKPKFFRDVISVKLIESYNSAFDQTTVKPGAGSKHWVSDEPARRYDLTGVPVVRTVSRKAAEGKPMDMAAYLKTIRTHDSGA